MSKDQLDVPVEVALDARADLAEGPVWDAERGLLIWVSINAAEVHYFDPKTGEDSSHNVGEAVGAAALREAGGLVLALSNGFAFLDEGGGLEPIADTEADVPGNRMNDGKCDPAGRFFAGTMSYDLAPDKGALYRLDSDRSVTKVLPAVGLSNGLDWSPDSRTFYYIDSLAHGIDAFDFDIEGGELSGRRRLVDIDPQDGLADGMTVDSEGYLWVALYNGWSLRRYAPDGSLDGLIRLPVGSPTSCTFGGEDMGDLYITTASQGLDDEARAAQPNAGGILRCRPGVAGRLPNRYAG